MNRDENAGTVQSTNLAKAVALGSLPAEIIGEDAPRVDSQVAIDRAVSRATSNRRTWDRKTLQLAYRAARPIVENDIRLQGKAFSRDDVRTGVRVRIHAYASKYGVQLPPGTRLGATELECVAGDICGGFSLPWTMFMPAPVQIAAKAAEAGSPHAKSWLARFFSKKSKPATPVAAPATSPAALATNTSSTPAQEVDAMLTSTAGSGDSLGDWMYQLNPLYWLKSAKERKFIDAEREAWTKNAQLQKKLGKQQEIVEQGQKALEAKAAAAASAARTAEIEAQLKSIESQLAGACMGMAEIVGGKSPRITEDTVDTKPNPFDRPLAYADAAPVLKKVQRARQLNAENGTAMAPICDRVKAGLPLSPEDTSNMLFYLARNEQLHEFRKALVNGEAYSKSPAAKAIQRQIVLGSVKALTPTEQLMMAKMIAMAKAGNPNAKKALEALKAEGYAVSMGATGPMAKIKGKPLTPVEQKQLTAIVKMAQTGNPNAKKALAVLKAQGHNVVMGSMGIWGLSTAWKIATAPVRGVIAATKWTGQELGIIKKGGGGGGSPENIRLAKMRAAAKRRTAALARARAADSQTEAEQRAQQQLAAAAEAEADAADAEAAAREAIQATAEAEITPAEPPTDAEQTDASGADSSAAKLKKARRAMVAKKNPQAAKILTMSETNTPAGMKLRASMELYRRAENKKSKERKAVAMMVAKAKKGDKQAQADVRALKAAGLAVKAERKAAKKVARVYAYRAASAKVKATRKRMEIAMADKLVRRSRARQLNKAAKIERRAAAGDRRCQAFVKQQIVKAKKGDKGAQKTVKALTLSKHVRTMTTTRRERQNLRQAQKLARQVARGNKRARAKANMLAAAAKHGNPNAKRAHKRLQTGAALEATIATGVVVLPGVLLTKAEAKKRRVAKKKADQRKVTSVETKIAKGTATREETVAAAKAAQDAGDVAKARELAGTAATLPSAKEELARVATVAAAAAAGSQKQVDSVNKAEKLATEGDPKGIEAMGKLAGVKALDSVSKGKDIDPTMKVAAKDVEAAQQGDPAALEKIKAMQEAAKAKDPEAIKYMVCATGAVVVARALANNPAATEQWKAKVGIVPASTENEDVQIAPPERTGPPPLSSLPDAPLPPICGFGDLVKASLSAIVCATKDPFANYREGVKSRGRQQAVTTASPVASSQTGCAKSDKAAGESKKEENKKSDSEVVIYKHAPSVEDVKSPIQIKPGSRLATAIKNAKAQAVERDKNLPIDRKVSADVLGSDDKHKLASEHHERLVEVTKKRISPIKEAATKGDVSAKKKWETVQANYATAKTKADKGDSKAKALVAILKDTGLFS